MKRIYTQECSIIISDYVGQEVICTNQEPQHRNLGKMSKFPHTNHKRSSVRSHTLAPTSICGLSHSVCGSPLTDLGHINSVTYVCHPLWVVCGHRKGILMSPLMSCQYYWGIIPHQTLPQW